MNPDKQVDFHEKFDARKKLRLERESDPAVQAEKSVKSAAEKLRKAKLKDYRNDLYNARIEASQNREVVQPGGGQVESSNSQTSARQGETNTAPLQPSDTQIIGAQVQANAAQGGLHANSEPINPADENQ